MKKTHTPANADFCAISYKFDFKYKDISVFLLKDFHMNNVHVQRLIAGWEPEGHYCYTFENQKGANAVQSLAFTAFWFLQEV